MVFSAALAKVPFRFVVFTEILFDTRALLQLTCNNCPAAQIRTKLSLTLQIFSCV